MVRNDITFYGCVFKTPFSFFYFLVFPNSCFWPFSKQEIHRRAECIQFSSLSGRKSICPEWERANNCFPGEICACPRLMASMRKLNFATVITPNGKQQSWNFERNEFWLQKLWTFSLKLSLTFRCANSLQNPSSPFPRGAHSITRSIIFGARPENFWA